MIFRIGYYLTAIKHSSVYCDSLKKKKEKEKETEAW